MTKPKVTGVPRTIRYALRKFEIAHDAYVFRGSQPPQDHEAIVEEYYDAKRHLLQTIKDALEK